MSADSPKSLRKELGKVGYDSSVGPEILFIKFDEMVKLNEMPRHPDNKDICVGLDSIKRSNSMLIFISHCWLRGHPDSEGFSGQPHPDNVAGDKFRLCIEGIKSLRHEFASRVEKCYVWFDYGCMDQDSKDMSDKFEQYDKIIQVCDCIFTPIVSLEDDIWFEDRGLFDMYRSGNWNVGPTAYLSRAWCRLEMSYAANIPLLGNDESGVQRDTMFDGGLAYHLSKNRRPHLVYISTFVNCRPPMVLNPLQYSYFHRFHPLNGVLSRETDRDIINELVEKLMPYIHIQENSVGYKGDSYQGLKHGRGENIFITGDTYIGEWSDDKMDGQGVLVFADGDRYEGEFRDGMIHGYGELRKVSVGGYKGYIVANQKQGQGTEYFSNGDKYIGEWKANKMHGFGVFYFHDGTIYAGCFENHLRHGYGELHFPNGTTYEGEWNDGRVHGHGMLRCASGSVYQGAWKNGKKHGYGTFHLPNGDMYEGSWVAGLKQGRGTLCNANGITYDGEWKADCFHGQGKLCCASGNSYDGTWVNHKKHGYGTKRMSNGDVYEGFWAAGKMHGRGVYTDSNGSKSSGEWINGVKRGEVVYLTEGGGNVSTLTNSSRILVL